MKGNGTPGGSASWRAEVEIPEPTSWLRSEFDEVQAWAIEASLRMHAISPNVISGKETRVIEGSTVTS